MKTRVFLIYVFLLILVGITSGDLNCQIESSLTCSAGVEFLHMSNITGGYDNAHAQEVNSTAYTNTLCCNSTNLVLGNSSGVAFLNLSNATNAHVQAPNQTVADYFIPAYISSSSNMTCSVYIDGCPGGYTCLVSIESDGADNTTNAHVSSCDVYGTEVCCGMNSPPNNVTDDYFLEPFHGNATLFNRTVTFQWLNTTDPDGDSLTYNIQIKQCGTSDPSTCNTDNIDYSSFTQPGEIDVSSITEGSNITEYISMNVVTADQNYTWRVRAFDGTDYSGWSENWTFYAPSTVMFTLFDENMSFGSMNPNKQNDTRDNSPYPFRVRNDGNVLTDFNLTVDTAEDWLWDNWPTPSTYFQYMIDNATKYSTYDEENGSFNWSASATFPGWNNMPETNTSANIRQLNYSDIIDEARIDINITVPSDEGWGDKGSSVRITGWVSST